jgi:hypothetical protein
MLSGMTLPQRISALGRGVPVVAILALVTLAPRLHAQELPAATSAAAAAPAAPAAPATSATNRASSAAAATDPPPAGSVAASSQEPDKAPEKAPVTELGGVVVKGKRNPLAESDRKLKELQNGLPNLNSDGKKVTTFTERMVDRAMKYLSDHSDPNKLNSQNKAFLQRSQDSLNGGTPGAIATPSAPPSRSPEDDNNSSATCRAAGTCGK